MTSKFCNTSLDFFREFHIILFKIPRYLFLAIALSLQPKSGALPSLARPKPSFPQSGLSYSLFRWPVPFTKRPNTEIWESS